MNVSGGLPQTFLNHAVDVQLRQFFTNLFQNLAKDHLAAHILNNLADYSLKKEDFPSEQGTYSRTIVTRAANGFEGMIARWSPGTVTAVHGHPDYAFYFLLEGRLGVEHFNKVPGGLECSATKLMNPGDHFCMRGTPGNYDNAIHRITAIEESLSVHVYSADALKGECFRDYPISTPFLSNANPLQETNTPS